MSTRSELDTFISQMVEMWGHEDALFQIIDETNQWDRKHGADWIFADVPYHLAYCNRDLVSRSMKLGRDFAAEERFSFVTPKDLGDWNALKFSERPPGQTAAESLAELRQSRDEICDIVADWTDADLERPMWMPFFGGNWMVARIGLLFTVAHDWSEFMQLRIHMGCSEPTPSPQIAAMYLGGALGIIYANNLNKKAAEKRTFTTSMAFTDPGVGSFIVEVRDGEATVSPGQAEKPDLVITQSAEAFERTIRGIQPPQEAIQDGSVQVSDMEKLAVFGELFPI